MYISTFKKCKTTKSVWDTTKSVWDNEQKCNMGQLNVWFCLTCDRNIDLCSDIYIPMWYCIIGIHHAKPTTSRLSDHNPLPKCKQNPLFCSEILSSHHILHVHSCKSLLYFWYSWTKSSWESVDLRVSLLYLIYNVWTISTGWPDFVNSMLVICANARLCWGGKSI